jgi:hypothetical protein
MNVKKCCFLKKQILMFLFYKIWKKKNYSPGCENKITLLKNVNNLLRIFQRLNKEIASCENMSSKKIKSKE